MTVPIPSLAAPPSLPEATFFPKGALWAVQELAILLHPSWANQFSKQM
jgi:hypothetical protein